MSLDALRRARNELDEPDEPTLCEGHVRLDGRLAIMLPDGDVAAADDQHFVSWLLEQGEPAPFGQDRETRLDPSVRLATRLVAGDQPHVNSRPRVQKPDVMDRFG